MALTVGVAGDASAQRFPGFDMQVQPWLAVENVTDLARAALRASIGPAALALMLTLR